jgi:hypothetical protein
MKGTRRATNGVVIEFVFVCFLEPLDCDSNAKVASSHQQVGERRGAQTKNKKGETHLKLLTGNRRWVFGVSSFQMVCNRIKHSYIFQFRVYVEA